MIHVINPLVEAGKNLASRLIRVLVYSASLTASGAVTQLFLALVGAPVGKTFSTACLALVALLAGICGLREVGLVVLPLPFHNWQVPKAWLSRGFYSSAVIYGLVLGTGFATRAPFSSFHVMVVYDLAFAGFGTAALLGAAYGISRSASLIVYSFTGASSRASSTLAASRWISRHNGYFHLVNGAVLTIFATVAGISLLLKTA